MKEMCGDSLALLKIFAGTGLVAIFARLQRLLHEFSRDREIVATCTNCICEGKVEVEFCITLRGMEERCSACWKVDYKDKLNSTSKMWTKLCVGEFKMR